MVFVRTHQRHDRLIKEKLPTREGAAAAERWAIEDPGAASARLRPPRTQPGSGSDPYQSQGQHKPRSGKKDLRKLSEWIEAKRKVDALKRQEATAALAKQKSPRKP
jgi:hypothetical protein